jgi:hypothetical protein
VIENSQMPFVDCHDLSLLAYALHMAETARSDAARNLFEAYAKQEQQRLAAGGWLPAASAEAPHPRASRRPTAQS